MDDLNTQSISINECKKCLFTCMHGKIYNICIQEKNAQNVLKWCISSIDFLCLANN